MIEHELSVHLINKINHSVTDNVCLMEVCGTHTQMIAKLGLPSVLTPKIKLLSGPGCPVCVTTENYIDTAIAMLKEYAVTIITFGDLLRVNGTQGSLEDEKRNGEDIRIVYSPFDCLKMVAKERDKNFVFLAVGFETTAPIYARMIKTAMEQEIKNLYFYTSLKLMPPVLHHILKMNGIKMDGLICPGHVASIMGSDYFRFVTETYGISTAICGFEAIDILRGIAYLVEHKQSHRNLYERAVLPMGNIGANKLLEVVFDIAGGYWRGIGFIGQSCYKIKDRYKSFDAEERFPVYVKTIIHRRDCICGDIMTAQKSPLECNLFRNKCTPQKPMGPCMVSSEGACAIAYRYRPARKSQYKNIKNKNLYQAKKMHNKRTI